MKAKVYFTRELTPEKVVEAYHKLGIQLPGKVGRQGHSGEKGNQNFLHPEFWQPMVQEVHGTIVECKHRLWRCLRRRADNTESHRKLLEEHRWTKFFPVDLLDAEGPDLVWPIPNGKILKQNLVGKDIVHYDLHAGAGPLQGPPHGRLRRGPQTAVHRLRLPGGQGPDPLRRPDRRPL